MNYERILVLLEGKTKERVEHYVSEANAKVEIADDGILLFNDKQLVLKITVAYYVKQTGAVLEEVEV